VSTHIYSVAKSLIAIIRLAKAPIGAWFNTEYHRILAYIGL